MPLSLKDVGQGKPLRKQTNASVPWGDRVEDPSAVWHPKAIITDQDCKEALDRISVVLKSEEEALHVLELEVLNALVETYKSKHFPMEDPEMLEERKDNIFAAERFKRLKSGKKTYPLGSGS